MRYISILIAVLFFLTPNRSAAQQVNGVFTPFARNPLFSNVVLTTATYENSGHITLGGYSEGALRTVNGQPAPNRVPLLMQVNSNGTLRADFGSGGYATFSSPLSTLNSATIDKSYLANTSSNPALMQFIISGHNEYGSGYMVKTFLSGARPTAYNNGDIRFFTETSFTRHRFVEDWVNGQYVVRKGGVSLADQKIILSAYSTSTGAPVSSFGNNGDIILPVPENQLFNDTLPVKVIMGGDNKLYVAFSIKTTSAADEIVIYRVLTGPVAKIDSSFGTAGVAKWPVPNPYEISSLNYHTNGTVTVGGYSTELNGGPSFINYNNTSNTWNLTSYSYGVNEPFPGTGCKNGSAKAATLNGEERLVYAYAKPTGTAGRFKMAMASYKPGGGSDPLLFNPWLGDEFISAEPADIIATGSTGFVVAGNATRPNGTIAGVVIKYNTDGSFDTGFATGGVLILNGGANGWSDMIQLQNNKYLAVGNGIIPDERNKSGILFQKFHPDGSIDTGFGTNGSVYAYPSTLGRGVSDIIELSDGKLLMGGTYTNYQNEPGIGTGTQGSKATIYRMKADGTPDSSFAFNGKIHYAGSGGLTYEKMLVQEDTIYMGGSLGNTLPGGGKGFIYKITPGGTVYSSYGARVPFLTCFAISKNTGNAFVGGGITNSPNVICKVKRGLPGYTGFADSSFGTNGLVTQAVNNTGERTTVIDVHIRPGYLFVLNIWRQSNTATAPSGIFFNSITSDDGVMDMTWGTNGNKFLQIPGASSVGLDQFEWINDGYELLIFGRANVSGTLKGFICKVNSSGDLVSTYGAGGIIWTNDALFASPAMIRNHEDDLVIIQNLGFFGGSALSKLKVPAAVFHSLKPGSWTGSIDNDWFKPGNWQAGVVPDDFTEVVINGGNVIIGGNRAANAFNVTLQSGATLTVQPGSSLNISSDDD